VLALFPGIEVAWSARVKELVLPNLQINELNLDVDRGAQRGWVKLAGRGQGGGELNLRLDYETTASQPMRALMRVELDRVDIDRLFGLEQGLLQNRTSGTLVFSSAGNSISEIFESMRGDADLSLDLRNDNDWQRDSRPEEKLGVVGIATLINEAERILGLTIENLKIDSIEQDISGTMSIAAGRKPGFKAELHSARLNLPRVLEWLPENAEAADQANFLEILRSMGPFELGIQIDKLSWLEDPINAVALEFSSDINRFDMAKLQFNYLGANVDSRASLLWKEGIAHLETEGELSTLVLNEFVTAHYQQQDSRLEEPLAGKFSLTGEGKSLTEISSHLSGEIKLVAEPPSRKKIDIDLTRIERGVEARINAFNWAGSELRGQVRYRNETRPDLRIELEGGTLDLRPWEEQAQPATGKQGEEAKSTVNRTGRFALDFLSYPSRALGGGKDTAPGERIFSSTPWDLSTFQSMDVHVHGQLDKLHSGIAEAEQLEFDARLQNGLLNIDTRIDEINGGSAALTARFDAATVPAAGSLDARFRDLYMDPERSTYPRDGHLLADSQGGSNAEIMGNLNGMGYMEFGSGPVDYRGLRLLTADVATSMFRALIPGAKTRQPTLNCGVTLAQFTDGKGITPYGWAARTRTANLLGAIEVDLKKEQLKLTFRSRSREGVGISIGNAFSNSVDITGPLSDPRIVPNTPGLIVRGWAAFLTAGLSIVGESVFNRALASSNPCKAIRKEIRKDLCKTDVPLASSPIACPPADAEKDATGQEPTPDSSTVPQPDSE
jgi:hypothetical protein